jgi:formamidopyrimidine-DNA glycosylase
VEAVVAGRRIEEFGRRGKNLLVELTGDLVLRVHLKMTGNLYVVEDARFRPSTARAWFELEGGAGMVFDDPRALGRITAHTRGEIEAMMAELGPEPLEKDFTVERFVGAARRSRKPAKLYLMDQTAVAGLGNIYAAEALFRSRIQPERVMNRLPVKTLGRLHGGIVEVLRDAVQSACTAYARPGRLREAETFEPQVYGREGEPCTVCRRAIRRIPQGGRSTYYCPGCQR